MSNVCYAVIGMRIDLESLYTKERVKAFDHNYSEDLNFDAKTGKPLWEEVKEPIKGYDEDRNELFGYKILDSIVSLDYAKDDVASPWQMTPIEFAKLESLKQEMRSKLGKLWNADAFGLWAILGKE